MGDPRSEPPPGGQINVKPTGPLYRRAETRLLLLK